MTGGWFAVELAAVAAGFLAALLVIRLWLPLPAYFTAAERLYVIGRAWWRCAVIAVVPLIAGLIAMWHAPGAASFGFAASSCGFTLAGWLTGQRRRAVRDSAGREPVPTDRD
jgi:hypothetical protein